MTTTTTGQRGARTVRGLAACVVLLLAAAGTAVANHGEGSTRVAMSRSEPDPTTTLVEETTTSTEATTTVPEPTTTPSSAKPRAAAPRPAAPKPTATTKPKPAPAPPPPASGITAAFYYGWYDGPHHGSFHYPGTRFHPTAGYYKSTDLGTVKRQIGEMRYGGIQAAIASWWGPGHDTDVSFPVGLKAAEGTPFKWSIYYEPEGPNHPQQSPDQIHASTRYIADKYANHPNYLRVDGRPVMFVWPDPSDNCDMVRRWRAANTGFYVVQKRFPGWEGCKGDADSWHEYSPNLYKAEVKGYSFSVSPGFWQYNQAPRTARDPGQFDAAVAAMKASSAQWKLVTTYNEWGEGTAVEPATEWATPSGYGVYLDILHRHLGAR